MNKLFSFVLICSLFFSCSDGNTYYFNFDEIDHYYNDIDGETFMEIQMGTKHYENVEYFMEVFVGYEPTSLTNLSFLDSLVKHDYVKTTLSHDLNDTINSIFREKNSDPNFLKWMCLPEYRDILVFKKNNEVIGIAKICFGCNKIYTIGTEANTEHFGSDKGYEKLSNLLR